MDREQVSGRADGRQVKINSVSGDKGSKATPSDNVFAKHQT